MSDTKFTISVRRDDVTVRSTKHTITQWSAFWLDLQLEGRGPTIPAALRDLAAAIETHALTELTKVIEAGEVSP